MACKGIALLLLAATAPWQAQVGNGWHDDKVHVGSGKCEFLVLGGRVANALDSFFCAQVVVLASVFKSIF